MQHTLAGLVIQLVVGTLQQHRNTTNVEQLLLSLQMHPHPACLRRL
jgi:hypothetical protein